jgi:hypothetical protein
VNIKNLCITLVASGLVGAILSSLGVGMTGIVIGGAVVGCISGVFFPIPR